MKIKHLYNLKESPDLCNSSHKLPSTANVTFTQCSGFNDNLRDVKFAEFTPIERESPRPLPPFGNNPLASDRELDGGGGGAPGALGGAGGGARAPGGGGGGGALPR